MLEVLALSIFMALIFLNVPISISMGLSSVISLLIMGVPGEVVPQKIVSGIQSWVLLAASFCILAAQIMNRGGVTERLFDFAGELVGWLKGGLAHANVTASMIFAGISGAAAADASGLGLLEIKAMTDGGYEKRFAVGVTAASCMLDPIISPSIMPVIYGHLAEISIAALWFAGIIPGIEANDLSYVRGEETILPFEPIVIDLLEGLEMILYTLVMGGVLYALSREYADLF